MFTSLAELNEKKLLVVEADGTVRPLTFTAGAPISNMVEEVLKEELDKSRIPWAAIGKDMWFFQSGRKSMILRIRTKFPIKSPVITMLNKDGDTRYFPQFWAPATMQICNQYDPVIQAFWTEAKLEPKISTPIEIKRIWVTLPPKYLEITITQHDGNYSRLFYCWGGPVRDTFQLFRAFLPNTFEDGTVCLGDEGDEELAYKARRGIIPATEVIYEALESSLWVEDLVPERKSAPWWVLRDINLGVPSLTVITDIEYRNLFKFEPRSMGLPRCPEGANVGSFLQTRFEEHFGKIQKEAT